MNLHLLMVLWLIVYFLIIAYLDMKFQLLRDTSSADKKPYSLSRVQLAWWMGFVLCAFVALVFDKNNPNFSIPTFSDGILIVLGISTGTTAAASLTDVSDQTNDQVTRHQNSNGTNLILDILSDKGGASVHRLQAVFFNLIFAIWFFLKVWNEKIIPDLEPNALILLGLSSGTYAALKTNENKGTSGSNPDFKAEKADEKNENEIPPVG
ncbi:MAG: hypothetical protein Q8S54_06950 [Bacteroidota bacterium]|nr:hypothetical protein [Bacteroidota bacterium]